MQSGLPRGLGTSTWQVLRATLHTEGLPGLYRGFIGACTISLPAHALYFSGYNALHESLRSTPYFGVGAASLLAGFGAEFISSAFWTPQDVVKQRLQTGKFSSFVANKGETLALLKNIWQQEGIAGFYKVGCACQENAQLVVSVLDGLR